MLHLLPAKERKEDTGVAEDTPAAWKKSKLEKQKAASTNPFNWNTLFMRANTVVDAMASSYGVSKSDMLDTVRRNGNQKIK